MESLEQDVTLTVSCNVFVFHGAINGGVNHQNRKVFIAPDGHCIITIKIKHWILWFLL